MKRIITPHPSRRPDHRRHTHRRPRGGRHCGRGSLHPLPSTLVANVLVGLTFTDLSDPSPKLREAEKGGQGRDRRFQDVHRDREVRPDVGVGEAGRIMNYKPPNTFEMLGINPGYKMFEGFDFGYSWDVHTASPIITQYLESRAKDGPLALLMQDAMKSGQSAFASMLPLGEHSRWLSELWQEASPIKNAWSRALEANGLSVNIADQYREVMAQTSQSDLWWIRDYVLKPGIEETIDRAEAGTLVEQVEQYLQESVPACDEAAAALIEEEPDFVATVKHTTGWEELKRGMPAVSDSKLMIGAVVVAVGTMMTTAIKLAPRDVQDLVVLWLQCTLGALAVAAFATRKN